MFNTNTKFKITKRVLTLQKMKIIIVISTSELYKKLKILHKQFSSPSIRKPMNKASTQRPVLAGKSLQAAAIEIRVNQCRVTSYHM